MLVGRVRAALCCSLFWGGGLVAVACAQPVSEAPEHVSLSSGSLTATGAGGTGGDSSGPVSGTPGSTASASSVTGQTVSGTTSDGATAATGSGTDSGGAAATSDSSTSDTASTSSSTASSTGGASSTTDGASTSDSTTTATSTTATSTTSTTATSTTATSTTGAGTTAAGTTGGSTGCSLSAPDQEIYDFSEWSGTTGGEWSADGGLSGGWFTYAGTGSSITVTHTAGTLRLTGTVNNYAGFGMSLESCTNASAYSGVSFEVGGTIGGTGEAVFQVQTQSNLEEGGECASDCANNQSVYSLPASPAMRTVLFTQLTGGSPVSPADPGELMGFQWQFHCATDGACALDVTLDDLSFAD